MSDFSIDAGLISVLMPAYNAENYIELSISSILQQTYTRIEILILDDASTDNTSSILKKYSNDKRIKLFKSENNIGYLNAVNSLFSHVNGDFVTFQDADDISDFMRFEKSINTISEWNVDFVSTGCGIIDTNGVILRRIGFPKEFNKNRDPYLRCCGSSIFLKRRLLDIYGGFNPYFNRIGSEDLEWATRLTQAGRYKYINEPLYMYRKGEGSITTDVHSELSLDRAVSHKIVELLVSSHYGKMNDRYWDNNEFAAQFKQIKAKLYSIESAYPYNVLWRTIDAYIYQGKIKLSFLVLYGAFRKYPLKFGNIKLFLKILKHLTL
ncbi:MAG: hypothetical protein RLZZ479_1092 [Bacteroidota bacterium]|jgi:glycosyltransferase involved in cell wall biosynthesis